MKSSRFIFIFIAVSLLLHIVLFFISLEPVQAVPEMEPKRLIPVDLAMKMPPDPPAISEKPAALEPVKPEAVRPEPQQPPTEPEPEPAEPEPEPEPEPAEPAAAAEPAPAPLPQMEAEPPASRSPAQSTEPRPQSPQAQPPAAQQGEAGTQAENPFAGLLQRLNENKKSTYPLSARKKGHQGTVYILLTLDEEGNMLSSEVVQKSSHSSLNAAALELIDKIMETPYPHNQGKTVRLKLPITYRLDG